MPPLSSSSTWFCIFCFDSNGVANKRINREITERKAFIQNRFLTMMQEYFMESMASMGACCCEEKTVLQQKIFPFIQVATELKIVSCTECFSILTSYCDAYDKINCLKMELNWKLNKLRKAMKCADEDISRLGAFQDWCKLEKGEVEKSMEFRKQFLNQCELRGLKEFPRVELSPVLAEKRFMNYNDTLQSEREDLMTMTSSRKAPDNRNRLSSSLPLGPCYIDSLSLTTVVKQESPEEYECTGNGSEYGDNYNNSAENGSDPDWFKEEWSYRVEERNRNQEAEVTSLRTSERGKDLSFADHVQIELALSNITNEENSKNSLDDDSEDPLEAYSDNNSDSEWFEDDDAVQHCRKKVKKDAKSKTKFRERKVSAGNRKKRVKRRIVKIASDSEKTISCQKCVGEPRPRFASVKALNVHHKYLHTNGYTTMTKIENLEVLELEVNHLLLHGFTASLNCCSGYFPECSQTFWSEEELENHLKYHEVVTCETCGVTKSNVVDMVHHELSHILKEHDQEIKSSCGKCEYSTALNGDLINHYLECHMNKPAIQATCPICKQQFKYVENVPLLHYINYHDLTRLEDPLSSGIQCIQEGCSAYFLTEDQLQQHWGTIHGKLSFSAAAKSQERKLQKEALKSKRRVMRRQKKGCDLSCEFCEKSFRAEIELKDHTWRYHADQKWGGSCGQIQLTVEGLTIDDFAAGSECVCRICENVFGSQEQLNNHEVHHGEFQCNFCDVVKPLATELPIHETMHNIGKQDGVPVAADIFKCPRCRYSSRKRQDYIDHHIENHLGLPPDRKRCPICKKATPDLVKLKCGLGTGGQEQMLKNWMISHYMEFHDKKNLDSEMSKCNLCQGYFRTAIQLDCHSREIHGITYFQCSDCGEIFDKREKLKRHRVKVHKVDPSRFQFLCSFPQCRSRFETQVELEYHEIGAHSEKDVGIQVCQICGKQCAGTSQLKGHMNVHRPGRPEKIKTGKGKQKRIKIKKELQDEPLVCEKCGKSFLNRDKLMAHRRRHRSPETYNFICPVCSKKCLTRYKLRIHLRSHTKEKPFSCEICSATFGFIQNLRSHMSNIHKKNEEKKKNTFVFL